MEPVRHLQAETRTTYVMFNNCYADYAPRNAQQMLSLLGLPQADLPVPEPPGPGPAPPGDASGGGGQISLLDPRA